MSRVIISMIYRYSILLKEITVHCIASFNRWIFFEQTSSLGTISTGLVSAINDNATRRTLANHRSQERRARPVNVIIIHDVDKESFRAHDIFIRRERNRRDSSVVPEMPCKRSSTRDVRGLSLVDQIGVIDRLANCQDFTGVTCLRETTCPILFSYL